MRIMARDSGVMDGILRCPECDGPLARVGSEYRCLLKIQPEELVAVGFIPSQDAGGKITFDHAAQDQQRYQASQAYTNSMEIDNAYLEKLGLDLQKIREYQLKYHLVA